MTECTTIENVTTHGRGMQIDGYIIGICDCGCSKITVPSHLAGAELWLRVHPSRGQESVSFKLTYEDAPPMHGWERVR